VARTTSSHIRHRSSAIVVNAASAALGHLAHLPSPEFLLRVTVLRLFIPALQESAARAARLW